ncbi:hypothetical protein SLA2020_480730 [Shorea laevis]
MDITGTEVGTLPLPVLLHSPGENVFVVVNSLLIRSNPRTLFRALQSAVNNSRDLKQIPNWKHRRNSSEEREKKEGLMIPLLL